MPDSWKDHQKDVKNFFTDIAATVEAIRDVAAILNEARTCVIEVNNNTFHAMHLDSTGHSHGGFGKPPAPNIQPHETRRVRLTEFILVALDWL